MVKNNYTQTSESSSWDFENGQIVWRTETIVSTFDRVLRQWIKGKPIVTYKTPQDLGYTKQAEFYVISVDEVPNTKKRGQKERLFFKEKVVASIRDPEGENKHVWLMLNSDTQMLANVPTKVNRYFIKDLNNGRTLQMPLVSTDYLKVEKDEPEAITPQEAKEILAKWNYNFDEVREEDGEQIYRTNVTKYVDNPM
ncbi:MAG: hypothetical protein NWE98_10130 [Candidatus Bathyarchaeota archaeon]|nr:hypothetical protein [Candidatus Bathyarchaeota archaeon]